MAPLDQYYTSVLISSTVCSNYVSDMLVLNGMHHPSVFVCVPCIASLLLGRHVSVYIRCILHASCLVHLSSDCHVGALV